MNSSVATAEFRNWVVFHNAVFRFFWLVVSLKIYSFYVLNLSSLLFILRSIHLSGMKTIFSFNVFFPSDWQCKHTDWRTISYFPLFLWWDLSQWIQVFLFCPIISAVQIINSAFTILITSFKPLRKILLWLHWDSLHRILCLIRCWFIFISSCNIYSQMSEFFYSIWT